MIIGLRVFPLPCRIHVVHPYDCLEGTFTGCIALMSKRLDVADETGIVSLQRLLDRLAGGNTKTCYFAS